MRTVLLDNYDSFSWNLYQLIGALDERPLVLRNDAIDLAGLRALGPARIVVSPGPGTPADPARFGVCADAIRELGAEVPILGVCLGLQGIVHGAGGRIIRAPEVVHGKASPVLHDGTSPLFRGIPRAFEAMRYHSLIADPDALPACLRITARTEDGLIMAIEHRTRPTYGVQFHPESIGTPLGREIVANFLFGIP
jgi:anthranilate synthase/aminodeoxychorismate synthase-like glutamine amidotransferase